MGGPGSGRPAKKKSEEKKPQQQQQQLPTEPPEEVPEEEQEEDDEEHYEEEEDEEDDDDDDEQQLCRPKLAEGFYEIEHVRRRKVRKKKVLYQIKWKGWPESANTWEPVENLKSCADIIEAFEEKRRSNNRKRRRSKSTLSKKKNRPSTSTSMEPVPFPSLEPTDTNKVAEAAVVVENEDHVDTEENHNDAAMSDFPAKTALKTTPVEIVASRKTDKADRNLNELEGLSSATVPGATVASDVTATADGPPNGENTEPLQTSRSKGARRRKSASVKRYSNADPALYQYAETETPAPTATNEGMDIVQGPGIQNAVSTGDGASGRNNSEASSNPSPIVKILKPIGFDAGAANNVQDVSITFMVLRSDGTEDRVDNKHLKLSNPLLLISFYEQHLRYNPM